MADQEYLRGFEFDGDRGGVLLLHGLNGGPKEMLVIARALNERGFACKGLCLPGHHTRVSDLACVTRFDWINAVENAAKEMAARWGKIFVVGSSLGSLLTLNLAAEQGRLVRAIALCSAPFFYDGWMISWWERMFARLITYTPLKHAVSIPLGEPFSLKDPAQRHEHYSYRTIPATSMAEAARLMIEVKNKLGHIGASAIILHSEEDELTSINSAHFLEQQIGSARKKKVILNDCYHLITVDRKSPEVSQAITNFFQEELDLHSNLAVRPVPAAGEWPAAV